MTVATEQNVAKVMCLIKEDLIITENETEYGFILSLGSLSRVLFRHLNVWKRSAGWVPHQLTEKQRRGRVEWCLHLIRKFDEGRSERVWDIVTGNETFFLHY